MVENTLQQYINSQLVGFNNQVLEAGDSTLTFDKAAGTATFNDPSGNETVYNANSTTPQYYVVYQNEGSGFQKDYIRIIEKNPISVKLQLVDPTEALFN